MKKNTDDVLKEDIQKKVKTIFERFLKETNKNRRSVGKGRFVDESYSFYQPHNLRLYFDFDKSGFSVSPKVETDVTRSVVTTERNNGHEKVFSNFLDCQIVVKKNQIEVRNFIEYKRWFRVFMGRARDDFLEIWAGKVRESIGVLKRFVEIYGGSSSFEWLNFYSEDKVAGEDKIDLIPAKMRFHGDVAKKVYRESNVEFKNPVLASNYLSQRSQEDFVLSEISDVKKGFDLALKDLKEDALVPLTKQIELHLKVQKHTLKVQRETLGVLKDMKAFFKPRRTLKELKELKGLIGDLGDLGGYSEDIRGLSEVERVDLSVWIGDRFGGG